MKLIEEVEAHEISRREKKAISFDFLVAWIVYIGRAIDSLLFQALA